MDQVDESMTNHTDGEARLPLSEDEAKVLELYDKLQELKLEIAVINAQSSQKPDTTGASTTGAQEEEAQNALLEARAKYRLRQDAVEAVMMATPILRAVHSGTQTTPVERDLLPYVKERDATVTSVAQHAIEVGKLHEDITQTQVDLIKIIRDNGDLAAQVFDLVKQVGSKKSIQLDNLEARQELERLEAEVKVSRQRWKVMKGAASGIIAGSGIDWARDVDLREIVLDSEDD